MFKSNSTRRGHEKYEKLDKESGGHNETSNEEYLKRRDINLQRNPTKKASSDHKEKSTTHPLLNFFDFRRKIC
ncbi:hypothetical protein MTR_7g026910 [Medicago truncatula]|uniref:Uncharacterized protein n=1 Tax=Medicago truncatula TaxID=3880 RepID=G7L140_MEDTR|nr:hypothetical protein MTR_7g026910 [Medicago truncatula]